MVRVIYLRVFVDTIFEHEALGRQIGDGIVDRRLRRLAGRRGLRAQWARPPSVSVRTSGSWTASMGIATAGCVVAAA